MLTKLMSNDMGEKKGDAGRPTKYKEEYNEQARKLCLLGATDKELADFFNVCEATINTWKIEKEGFLESIKSGKVMADATVAEKLYHRAIGYSHKEVKIATSEGRITDEKEYDKHYAPDPTAAIFWLKNRNPSQWRDKQQVEHSGSISELSDEEINRRLAELVNESPDSK
jgi:hypothetical protein